MLCIIIGWFVGIMTMYNSYTSQLCMLSCNLAKVINQNTWCDLFEPVHYAQWNNGSVPTAEDLLVEI